MLLVLILFVILNFPFVWQNIKYTFITPKTVSNEDLKSNIPTAKIEPNTLIIDSLGLKLPIVQTEEKTEDAYQEALRHGVVHYPDTANPGEFGNAYIFGHSSDYAWAKGDYKTAFALLPRIERGAQIVASDWNGNPFKYKVVNTFVVNPEDLWVLDQQGYKKRLLTLQTSYPLGTALRRFIVAAEMEEDLSNVPLPGQ